jgi:catechol 2,3-dioxygenase-like lactoylglutathione lyase family enzyme
MRSALVVALGLGLGIVTAAGPADAELRAKFELFVDDVDASTRFYQGLGFRVAHVKPSDGYTTLERDGVVVALSPLPRWLPPLRWLGFLSLPPLGTEIVFYPDDLEALHESLSRAGRDPAPAVGAA